MIGVSLHEAGAPIEVQVQVVDLGQTVEAAFVGLREGVVEVVLAGLLSSCMPVTKVIQSSTERCGPGPAAPPSAASSRSKTAPFPAHPTHTDSWH